MVQPLGACEQSCVSMHYSVNNTLLYAANKKHKNNAFISKRARKSIFSPSSLSLALRSPVSSRATFLHQDEREKTSRRSDRIYPLNTAGGQKRVCVHVCQLRSSRKERGGEKKKKKREKRETASRFHPSIRWRQHAGRNRSADDMEEKRKKEGGFCPMRSYPSPRSESIE